MKRLRFNSLYIWIVVSILFHYAVFRYAGFEKKTFKRETERYEVKLLYYKPPAEKKRPEPKKIKKKKKVIKKPVEKIVEPRKEIEPEPETEPELEPEFEPVHEEVPEYTEEEAAEEVFEAPPVAKEPAVDFLNVIQGIRKKIIQKKIYPYAARKKGIQGIVFILLKLDEQGYLIELRVTQSSGSKILDKAAVSLIKKVVPYEHGTGQPISIEIPIKYSLLD
ncbi:MAG TPA: energy transducer TonB [Spirochaetes bacterium]|nr:energy transducer TonB [Spirochaetota bacterium]